MSGEPVVSTGARRRSRRRLPRLTTGLPPRRRLAGLALAAVLLPVSTVVLALLPLMPELKRGWCA